MKDDLQEVLWTVRTLAENYAEVPSPIVRELLELLDEEEDRDALAKEHVTASETEPLEKETIVPDSTCPTWCTTTPRPHGDHYGGWDNRYWPDDEAGGDFELMADIVQLGGNDQPSVMVTLDGHTNLVKDGPGFSASPERLREVANFLLGVANSVGALTR